MGSYVWKASWGPTYRQSMLIALCCLLLSSVLGLGTLGLVSPSLISSSQSYAPSRVSSHATNANIRKQTDGTGRTGAYGRSAGADRGSGEVGRYFIRGSCPPSQGIPLPLLTLLESVRVHVVNRFFV